MKWIVRSMLFVTCLVLFAQAEVALCQDQITASRGETVSNLQLGLQNTGLIGYEAYADAHGDAASWCVPMRLLFGYVGPGETKSATYRLIIPRDVSPDTYYLFWDCYARSGSYTKHLFSSTVRITVVAAMRDPVLLLPLWAVVCAAALAPLWHWTKKEKRYHKKLSDSTDYVVDVNHN